MKKNSMYVCTNCGYEIFGRLGKCPECDEWGTFVEKEEPTKKNSKSSSKKSNSKPSRRLTEIETTNSDRIITNLEEFNRVMGGGIVKDSVTIVAADRKSVV